MERRGKRRSNSEKDTEYLLESLVHDVYKYSRPRNQVDTQWRRGRNGRHGERDAFPTISRAISRAGTYRTRQIITRREETSRCSPTEGEGGGLSPSRSRWLASLVSSDSTSSSSMWSRYHRAYVYTLGTSYVQREFHGAKCG